MVSSALRGFAQDGAENFFLFILKNVPAFDDARDAMIKPLPLCLHP
jgi:hypothetical protein